MNGFKHYTNRFVRKSRNAILKTNTGFYLRYNDHPRDISGSTTAIVVGQYENKKNYILIGDHREKLAELSRQGLDACLEYYRSNPDLQHKYSDKLN